jgi:hypothetical protein
MARPKIKTFIFGARPQIKLPISKTMMHTVDLISVLAINMAVRKDLRMKTHLEDAIAIQCISYEFGRNFKGVAKLTQYLSEEQHQPGLSQKVCRNDPCELFQGIEFGRQLG